MTAVLEALFGQLYLVTIVAVIVSNVGAGRVRGGEPREVGRGSGGPGSVGEGGPGSTKRSVTPSIEQNCLLHTIVLSQDSTMSRGACLSSQQASQERVGRGSAIFGFGVAP